ncbi:uncharacterized protein LOC109709385 [Ananas comosus]|uniref:Uncharacterized protein LOC109709385 n=1 Tax=Ananas comosus TaxID=4615 RepID=A0A6P5F117_ANACO|nr:uncharacterized protein LOC109709385 [Ananas comosus]
MMKSLCLLSFFLLMIFTITAEKGVEGAGECGRVSPDRLALRLAPCASASQDPQADVSDRCCSEVHTLGQNPGCLCAVMLSETAKSAGVKPEVAITIPKRCNLVDRPVGYKCGGYTLP